MVVHGAPKMGKNLNRGRLFVVTYPASADPTPPQNNKHAEAFVTADSLIGAIDRFVSHHGFTPTGVREAGPTATATFERLTSGLSLTA